MSGFAAGDWFSLSKQGNLIVLTFSPMAAVAVFGAGLGLASWMRRRRSAANDV